MENLIPDQIVDMFHKRIANCLKQCDYDKTHPAVERELKRVLQLNGNKIPQKIQKLLDTAINTGTTKEGLILALQLLGVDIVQAEAISIQMAVPGSIILCMSVARIIETYNSTKENEDKVSTILSMLCKMHFTVVLA